MISLNHCVTAQITHSKISLQNVINKTSLRKKKLNFRVHDLEKYSCGLFAESKRLFNVKMTFSKLWSVNHVLAENDVL